MDRPDACHRQSPPCATDGLGQVLTTIITQRPLRQMRWHRSLVANGSLRVPTVTHR